MYRIECLREDGTWAVWHSAFRLQDVAVYIAKVSSRHRVVRATNVDTGEVHESDAAALL